MEESSSVFSRLFNFPKPKGKRRRRLSRRLVNTQQQAQLLLRCIRRKACQFFRKLLKWLLGGEDEHEFYYDGEYVPEFCYDCYNRLPELHDRDHRYDTSHRYLLPPPKPPSTLSKPVLSPFNPPSSSPKPPTMCRKPQSSSLDTSSSSPKFVTSLSKVQQWSCGYAFSTFLKPPTSSSKLPPSPFVTPSSSSLQPPTPSSTSSPFSPQLSTHFSKPLQASLFRPRPSLSKRHPLSPKPPTSSSRPSPSSPKGTPFSPGPPLSSAKLPPVFKTFLSPASSNEINEKEKKNYVWVDKGSLPIFTIPGNIKDLIKNDIVPKVLNQPLSSTTYKDYFAVLL
ncbi:hypothetical protein ACE6H2_000622 [Prunus campanulata]